MKCDCKKYNSSIELSLSLNVFFCANYLQLKMHFSHPRWLVILLIRSDILSLNISLDVLHLLTNRSLVWRLLINLFLYYICIIVCDNFFIYSQYRKYHYFTLANTGFMKLQNCTKYQYLVYRCTGIAIPISRIFRTWFSQIEKRKN